MPCPRSHSLSEVSAPRADLIRPQEPDGQRLQRSDPSPRWDAHWIRWSAVVDVDHSCVVLRGLRGGRGYLSLSVMGSPEERCLFCLGQTAERDIPLGRGKEHD